MAYHPHEPARHICLENKGVFQVGKEEEEEESIKLQRRSGKTRHRSKEAAIKQLWFSSIGQHAEGEAGRVGTGAKHKHQSLLPLGTAAVKQKHTCW